MTEAASPPAQMRSALVVPAWCVSPLTGGGQRTAIFFSALKQLGPTEVVVLGYDLQRAAIEPCFPNHAGLHLIETGFATGRRLVGLRLQLDRVRRYLMFWQLYRPDPSAHVTLRARAEDGVRVMVYRYFQTFCWAGPEPEETWPGETRHFVDIDDRDDQKLQVAMQDFLRSPMLARLYGQLVLPHLARLMRRRLARAQLAWLAAAEDVDGLSGLDTALIANVPFTVPEAALPLPSSQRDLLFVGDGGFAPNRTGVRWFLQTCWPAIQARHPESRLRIVGSGDWQGIAAEFPDMTGVDFVGRVDSLAKEYARARLTIVPISIGGGTKIKMIESCAFGRPVVSTSHSARGFGGDIQAKVLQGDTPEAFAAACLGLLDDGAEADALGAELQELQQAKFSRQAVEAEIGRQLRAALAQRPAASV